MVSLSTTPKQLTEYSLAVDIGGTKLAVGIVDEEGHLFDATMAPTPKGDGESIFSTLRGLIATVLQSAKRDSVVVCGVGCGGPMRDDGAFVSPLNIPGWRDFPLRERLSTLLQIPVFVDNDAKALALGEGWVGAAKGVTNFLAMVVSTGVGGGIVLNGRLLDGRLGNAGHIGHVIVTPTGRACGCGAKGCLEAEASGTALHAMTGQLPTDLTGRYVERTGMMVGRAVAIVSSLLDLDLALVGGSVALGMGERFFVAANAELHERAKLSFSSSARIAPVGLGGDGPLVGAGAVGWRGIRGG